MSDLQEVTDIMVDEIRRKRVAEINSQQLTRESLEQQYGKVWTMDELRPEFEILAFAAPFVIARRKSDGKKGTFEFSHMPRFYFNWMEDK